ncbi:uncharacterized protein LOC133519629 [Cydia pomonella]|uniref:uncharacterized protein LOC133519629 n=1 Tax=Cydia pomonella TaxID=82600 RepID=UPI002ADD4DAD|nr:uncharacterized protein LOC133519629 [Cydia pomonella]
MSLALKCFFSTSTQMSDRDKDWVPVAAGIVLGLGVLALLYKYWGGSRSYKKGVNQQMGYPFQCKCESKSKCPHR